MDSLEFLQIPGYLLENLNVVYSAMLIFTRYASLMFTLPGIGGSERAIAVRVPFVFVLTIVTMVRSPLADVPTDWVMVAADFTVEFLFGAFVGMIPQLVVVGIQAGAQIISTSMGLSAGQLFDPTTGSVVNDLARIMGDLTVIVFLMLGGHYAAIYAASGVGSGMVPGSFEISQFSVQLFIDRTADILRVGVLISAPVVVALLLTQFVMGLISRAVPTVNIFIVSFPLTIGIGLILLILSLRDIAVFIEREFVTVDTIFQAFPSGF
jgi:flagellar biosynthetic protein FliR